MFLLEVLYAQWIVLGLGGGLIFMLAILLFYTAGWRPRMKERESYHLPLDSLAAWRRWGRLTFPWILVVTLVGIALWSILYPLFYSIVPPNW
ncbi:MAG: hypothetical protein WDA20_01930 [Desulfuromonadales bacterium]